MRCLHSRWLLPSVLAGTVAVLALPSPVASMCGYFRPIIVDIKQPIEVLQPSQIAFITWDPEKKMETVTVQPRFEGNALDFGMVIPTPSQPKLDEMPRDFFKELAVFTILEPMDLNKYKRLKALFDKASASPPRPETKPTTVKVLEAGVVGSL